MNIRGGIVIVWRGSLLNGTGPQIIQIVKRGACEEQKVRR